MRTQEDLHNPLKEKLSGYLFVVISNREPYIHTFSDHKIAAQVPASGLTTALDPLMQACGGIWIANSRADTLLVNPYATDHFPEAIKNALEMPKAERRKRMRKMREVVRENNIYKWAGDIISDLAKYEFGE